MPKLHELLAVEGDLKSRTQQTKNAITKLFTDGTGRLLGRVITYQVDEGEDPRPPEVTELATTAAAELDQFGMVYSQWLDAAIQKEVTNQVTMATVIVEGNDVLNVGLPATALLNLESKLTEIRTVYAGIPTLDPSERWEWDAGSGHYISTERVTNITKKVPQILELSKATEQHPAQVQSYHEDVKVGTRTTLLRSGMLAPMYKQQVLDRIDKLLRAVKEARQRANDVEVDKVNVAKAIFNYISGLDSV
jgi:hypothetical protein